MYLVTTKHPEYVLFAITPSERAALGLTEKGIVKFLLSTPDGSWRVLHQWDTDRFSHTAFMAALQHREEPDDPQELLALLPANLR